MFQHLRRAVGVMLAALVMLAAPQVAHAAFSARVAPQMQVGTATLAAPDNVSGTRECLSGGGLSARITDFSWDGPEDAVFRYSIYRANSSTPTVTGTRASRNVTITTGANRGAPNTWRLTISAELGNWTSPEWSRTYGC